jgi:hypothetical protein
VTARQLDALSQIDPAVPHDTREVWFIYNAFLYEVTTYEASVAFRVSIGRRRKSLPSSATRSKA